MRNALSQALLLCVVSLLTVLECCRGANYFPPQEYDALQSLFNATSGDEWYWGSSAGVVWDFRGQNVTNPCLEQWQGITCSSNCTVEVCHVIQINLPDTEMRNQLPESLYNLTMLQSLLIGYNYLTGYIPTCIGLMTNLQHLDITGNGITGQMPSEIGNASSLTSFLTQYNMMRGTLPDSIGNLMNLTTVNFDQNSLTGTLPSSIGNCRNLTTFKVADNWFHGTIPLSFSGLPKLKYLELTSNKLSGTFESWFLTLETLHMQYNNFYGTLPYNLGNESVLVDLDINVNSFVGTIPQSWSSQSNFKSIYFGYNALTGTVPNSMFTLPHLKTLVLDANIFTGPLPVLLPSLPSLTLIDLSSNLMTGTFPAAWCQCPKLVSIYLDSNLLTGTIPTCIQSLHSVFNLLLQSNELSGTLPAEIGNMTRIYQVQVQGNQLTGSISPKIVHASGLTALYMYFNYMTGPFPSNLAKWKSIRSLYVNNNFMTSTIPTSICNSKTKAIQVQDNFFSGTIPNTMGNCVAADQFYFNGNLLTGTLPASFGNISLCNILYVSDNFLTGTIPHTLTQPTRLGAISFAFNFLSGDMTTAIQRLPLSIEVVNFAGNMFTGTIPAPPSVVSTHLPVLVALDMGVNSLTGTVPANLTFLFPALELLFVQRNSLYGTLPANQSGLQYLNYVNVSGNRLHGSLNGFVVPNGELGLISVAYNFFSGRVESVFNTLRALFILDLNNNLFTGPLEGLLDPQNQPAIVNIDVSSNALSGTLPTSWFGSLQKFQSFVVAINCFTGSIPPETCQSNNLSTIVLDGLHASPQCNHRIFPWGSSEAYSLRDGTITGGIPECLFSLPFLETLHVAGNGLSGQLSLNFTVGPHLQNLVLSHNALSGTIPPQIFDHHFTTLDLSFNRFGGTLPSSIAVYATSSTGNEEENGEASTTTSSSTTFNLQVNRLSGTVPEVLREVSSINILEGNMFECEMSGSDLPVNDPEYSSYQCGSDFVNASLVIWFICLVSAFVLATVGFFRWFAEHSTAKLTPMQHIQSIRDSLRLSYSTAASTPSSAAGSAHASNSQSLETPELKSSLGTTYSFVFFLEENIRVLRFIGLVVVFILFVFMIAYGALTVNYGTYVYQYAWTVSFSYLEGIVPAVVIMVLLIVFVIWLLGLRNGVLREPLSSTTSSSENPQSVTTSDDDSVCTHSTSVSEGTSSSSPLFTKRELLIILLIIAVIINCAINLLVNGGYVLAVSRDYSLISLAFISLGISLFKLIWGNYVVIHGLGHLVSLCLSSRWQMVFLISIAIFNNIIAPYAAEGFVSPNCFQYALQAPPDLSATLYTVACYVGSTYDHKNLTVNCGHFISYYYVESLPVSDSPVGVSTVTFNPPFLYSYQCSSSLLTAFAYVFVMRYLFSGAVWPLLVMMLKVVQQRLWWSSNKQQGDYRMMRAVTRLLPYFCRPLFTLNHQQEDVEQREHQHQVNLKLMSQESTRAPQILVRAYTVRMVSDLMVLLTFGVLFPPLALVIAISMVVDVRMTELAVAYFLWACCRQDSSHMEDWSRTLRKLHSALWDARESMSRMLPFLVFFAALFWTFSLYDTAAGDVGAVQAVWVAVIMLAVPLLLLGVFHRNVLGGWTGNGINALWHRCCGRSSSAGASSGDRSDDGHGADRVDSVDVINPLTSRKLSVIEMSTPGSVSQKSGPQWVVV